MLFNRVKFFNSVRDTLFSGSLSQQQVDGMNFKLAAWEKNPRSDDLRHLANAFATSYHETAKSMWPVEEIGKGAGRPYGKPHPKTGLVYYGRGDVQLTHYENYVRATTKLGLTGDNDLEWHPEKALDPTISADVMYQGMTDGWFRKDSKGPHDLARYFNDDVDDAFNAREIINGDKKTVPKWSNGVSIGNLVKTYHNKFHFALKSSFIEPVPPEPEEEIPTVSIVTTGTVKIMVNGKEV